VRARKAGGLPATRDELKNTTIPLHTGSLDRLCRAEQELRALSELLTEAVQGEEQHGNSSNTRNCGQAFITWP